MKRKLIAFLLAATVAASSFTPVSASEDIFLSNEDFSGDISGNETDSSFTEDESNLPSESEETNTESEQTETEPVSQESEPELPNMELPEETEPVLPDTEPELPEELPEDIPEELPEELPEEMTYEVTISGDADVYFAADLEALKNGTLELPAADIQEGLEADPEIEELELVETDEAKTAAIQAAKEILPEEIAPLLDETTYDLLMDQEHVFSADELVGFYVVPDSGNVVDKVTAYSVGEVAITDYGNQAYEMYMPESDVILEIAVKPDVPETEAPQEEESETEQSETEQTDAESEEESEGELSEEELPVECTCMSESSDPYEHDWNCDLFMDTLTQDCSCGSFSDKVTDHDFDCFALQSIIASVCDCGIGNQDGVMHDNCEFLVKTHEELCSCGEECRTLEAGFSHSEDNPFYQYLDSWAEYCNQPVPLWTNNDTNQTKPYAGPIVSAIGDNAVEDKNYAFVFKYRSGSAPNGGCKVFNSSGVAGANEIDNANASLFKAKSMADKNATVSCRYYNVGIYNGKKIDVELLISQPQRINYNYSSANIPYPYVGFFTNRIGVAQALVHDMKVQFKFWENNTNTPVYIKGHTTIKDIDGDTQALGTGFRSYTGHGVERISIYNEKVTINGKQYYHLGNWYKKTSNGTTYTLIKGRKYAAGTDTNISPSDKKGWAVLYFNGSWFDMRVELGDSFDSTGTGNRHAGVEFESTVIGKYELDTPGKCCGSTSDVYDKMSWHNTSDANHQNSWQRPYTVSPGGVFRYCISHTVYPMTYSSYSVSDQLDTCLTYVNNSAQIMTASGLDVTGKFNVSYDSGTHKVTFTLKELSLLDNKETFYFYMNVKLANAKTIVNHNHHNSSSYYWIANKAAINVNGTNLSTNSTYIMGNIRGSYRVKKYDTEDKSLLNGAVFDLQQWDKAQNKFVHVKDIRQNNSTKLYDTGTLTYTNNNLGRFKLVEKTAPSGYDGGWSREFNILSTANGATFDAPNTRNLVEYGTISIVKKDSITGENIITTDGVFQVWQWSKAQNKYLDNLGDNGKVTWNSTFEVYLSRYLTITDDNLGKFKVVETKNPTGYEGKFEREFVLVESEEAMELEMDATNEPLIPPSGEITVTKKIKESDITWAHGNPVFRFTVSGTDIKGESHTYEDYVEFSKGNYNLEGDYATLRLTFKNIPLGEYTVSEKETMRYKFESVAADTSNVKISNQVGIATLSMDAKQAGVTFRNNKTLYDGYSHTDVVKNTVPIKW